MSDRKPRILIVKLSALGDLFHALPAVHALRSGLDSEIHWCVQSEYSSLVKCFSDVSRVIDFPRRNITGHFQSFRANLRETDYEMTVDMQGLMKSALVTAFSRARRKIGPSFRRECAGLFYNEVAGERDKNRHAVEENMDIVRYLGLPDAERMFPVAFPSVEVHGASPRIALLPSSRWPTKNWPVECFVKAALEIRKKVSASFHVIGGAGDRQLCDALAAGIGGGTLSHAGKTDLVQTAGLLAEMDLLIANDSGPVHMAAAVGTPALVIFGPTDPVRTGPYGHGHRIAAVELPCRPCFSRSCREEKIKCLLGVTPERVGGIALEMLASRAL